MGKRLLLKPLATAQGGSAENILSQSPPDDEAGVGATES